MTPANGGVRHAIRASAVRAALVALALIAAATVFAARRADRQLRNDFLRQVRMVAQAVGGTEAAALTGTAADVDSPVYHALKTRLHAIRTADPQCRFVYLMARRPDGTVVFLVDSEPETSPDYSPPGQVYEEASDFLLDALETGLDAVEGPEQDRWGVWVSALVPLEAPAAESRALLLGMDIDARNWRQAVASRAALPAALAAIAVLLGLSAFTLHRSRREIRARQARLAESEERFAQLSEQSRTSVWEMDAAGLYTYVSPVAESIFGYRPDELVGQRHFYDLHPESDRLAFQQAIFARFARQEAFVDFESEARTKDGRTVWLSTNALPLRNRDGSLRGYRGSDMDITERRRAEEALRASEKKWSTLFDAMEECVAIHQLVFDASGQACEGRLLEANAAFCRLAGGNKDELVGRSATELPAGGGAPPLDRFAQAVATGVTCRFESFDAARGRHYSISAVPLGPDRFATLMADVTERRLAEDRTRASLEESTRSRRALLGILEDEQRVREELERRLADLNRAQTALMRSEKLASLGKLISEVAHEISNPLMIVSCNAQLAQRPEIGPAESARLLGIIGDECQRAKAILKRLLRFAAPGQRQLRRVDPNAALEAVVALLENQLKWSHIDIRRAYAEQPPAVAVDEHQMQEVFMNLINNAREAMPGGGTLELATAVEGDRLRLDFRDTGGGIPEKDRKSIFEPFFTTKTDGTGLGLSVCYAIVKAHGGEINFESDPNVGTTFTIWLPVAKDDPLPAEP